MRSTVRPNCTRLLSARCTAICRLNKAGCGTSPDLRRIGTLKKSLTHLYPGCTMITIKRKKLVGDLCNIQTCNNRYEVPEGSNRWDSPLFTVMPEDNLTFDEIYCYLYKGKLPKPNLSTQNVSIFFPPL